MYDTYKLFSFPTPLDCYESFTPFSGESYCKEMSSRSKVTEGDSGSECTLTGYQVESLKSIMTQST